MAIKAYCDFCRNEATAFLSRRVPITTPEGRKLFVSLKLEQDTGEGPPEDRDACLNCLRHAAAQALGIVLRRSTDGRT